MPKRSIEDLLATWEPRLREAFLNAFQRAVDRANVGAIETMIKRGDIEGAINAVGIDASDFREVIDEMHATFNAGGQNIEGDIPTAKTWAGATAEFRFDLRNATAETIIKEQSSTLVTELVEGQRDTIRQHLLAGLEAGSNPRTTAIELVGRRDPVTGQRTGGVVGLTSGQEQWQRNYAARLASNDPIELRKALGAGLRNKRYDAAIRKAIETGKPIPKSMRDNMMRDYRNKTLKYRADVISRTETMRSLGQAQTEAMRQAIDAGHVSSRQIVRYWVTAGDERVRHTHRLIPGMNKGGVAWDQPFMTPTGPVMHAPHDRDPQCRCHERLKVDYLARVRENAGAMA